ncbi:lipoprotein LpqH [Tsukamurella pseudospumae]|uniref:Lipoprotein LpqH n=1 Tax=Tsukamurella pseudospumae TaxID=239498 RepID=A0A138AUY5_9ACTN|nr:lipoprotein LpqH [Tsukamurella pseudospumae]KXP14271.1 hypothetical protein AXK60_20850 [Tsukamurella pseudospumae]
MNRSLIAAVTVLAAGSFALTACGGSDAEPKATTGGDAAVKVDGKDLPGLDLGSVTCVKSGGRITIGSAAIGGQQGVGIVLSDATPPKVESLGIVFDGTALAVAPGAGKADVKVDGSRYTVTGEAQGASMSNPAAGLVTKSFEVAVTCK